MSPDSPSQIPVTESAPGPVPASFRFHIHTGILDKPAAWDPDFATGWQPVDGTIETLRTYVRRGTAFVPVAMTSDHRSSAAFDFAQLAVVDVDHGLDLEDFLTHPLARHAAYVYTTANHSDTKGQHRYRVIFQLPHAIRDPLLYRAAITLLIRALGGDKSCTDPCRLFYSFQHCQEPLVQPQAQLPPSFLKDAEAEAIHLRNQYEVETVDYSDNDIARAVHVLEQVIPPTCDGQRDLFTRVTAAARSAGEALFPAWSDWASRGHHGKGKNANQATERFYRGFRGSSLATLFHLADDADPDWRSNLPEELRPDGAPSFFLGTGVAGYDHGDFLGYDDDVFGEASAPQVLAPGTVSLFGPEAPWAPQPPIRPRANDDDPDPDPEDLEPGFEGLGGGATGHDIATPKRSKREDIVERIKERLQILYPGLRLNSMSLDLEHGPRDNPIRVVDIATAYVRISRGSGTVFPKTLVTDTAHVIGAENAYHPVRKYLEHCAGAVTPCPYFHRLASELLGLPDDELLNPTLPNGRHLADVILERFLVGAVARVLSPGCQHDWMPILIGSQNSGKTNFFRYLTPPDVMDPGHYPWAPTIPQGMGYIKDRPHVLHAGWIVLLDEVERYFQRRFTEELKNLVSVSVDRSARKYENERSFPRSFVLAGTANNADFLVDPTGNRRFMPIIVAGKVPSPENHRIRIVDLDRLKVDRDAIWSAAYRAYMDRPIHLFSSSELAVMSTYLEGFTTDSPLDARLSRILDTHTSGIHGGQNYVTLSDVFLWLEIPIGQQGSMQLPVADAMKRLGWKMIRRRIAGPVRRIWIKSDGDCPVE